MEDPKGSPTTADMRKSGNGGADNRATEQGDGEEIRERPHACRVVASLAVCVDTVETWSRGQCGLCA